jgi:hypothetical protein
MLTTFRGRNFIYRVEYSSCVSNSRNKMRYKVKKMQNLMWFWDRLGNSIWKTKKDRWWFIKMKAGGKKILNRSCRIHGVGCHVVLIGP